MIEQQNKNLYPTIIQNMVKWYDQNHEVFPWRENKDPYSVWVSEIMLQQTTVQTVIPYYQHFMRRFPDISALANADEEIILAAWQGLGYYRRARMLHQAAKILLMNYDGNFPTAVDAIKKMPGIGDYTAKAISSISFDMPVVPMDGNVIRVMSRLFAISQSVEKLAKILEPVMGEFENALAELKNVSGQFAQSLMDLGREVCKPRTPKCSLCPLSGLCQSYAQGIQGAIPLSKEKKVIPMRYAVCTIAINLRGKFLIQKRQFKGVLEGLWEFPTSEFSGGLPNNDINPNKYLGSVKHIFSHFKLNVDVYVCEKKNDSNNQNDVWVDEEEMQKYALSTLMRKIFALYTNSIKKAA